MAMHLSTRRWQDQLMVVIGVCLFVTPWVFTYPPGSPEAWNATLAGAIIGILAAFDLVKTYVWAVLFNIIVGAWVTVSPWMVGTLDDLAMTWSLVIAGIATIVLGLWELRSDPELYSQWRSGATG
ncbi:SPW repeat protein [Telluria aromaticivorans]|uniref:SPW repeat protein n=1 Tax=Telluria aromaticivorans TaxID=2725995 RepID=A0A7Y2P276_9BURK|nr:SPW repeat protein [Telluria aromaticivorans]NNG24644.1 SPW repeat protein [Telluria aromaticivorans]